MTNCNNCTCNNNCHNGLMQFGTDTKIQALLTRVINGTITNGYNIGDILDANAIIDLVTLLTQDMLNWKHLSFDTDII